MPVIQLICTTHHVIGFSDRIDLWVINKKPMILCNAQYVEIKWTEQEMQITQLEHTNVLFIL